MLHSASALSRWEPVLGTACGELAAALAGAQGSGQDPEAILAWLSCADSGDESALGRAVGLARGLADSPEKLDGMATLALAKVAVATSDEKLLQAARTAAFAAPQEEPLHLALARSRAMLCLGGEEAVSAAKAVQDRACRQWLLPTGGVSPDCVNSAPESDAQWVALASELYNASPHVRQLDIIEAAAFNQLLFEQSDDGGGITQRTLDGAPGNVEDLKATPMLSLALATVASRTLFVDHDGALAAGFPVNASAVLALESGLQMRCLVSTQLPVRGWTCWLFEPKDPPISAPIVTTTRRTARRQRPELAAQSPAETRKEETPATFAFRVRVPKWALDEKNPPVVKVDGEKANVKKAGGFLYFEVPTGRPTKIEVILNVKPGMFDRQSVASWAREVALSYGPLVLTVSGRLNPGEDLGLPLRLVSTLEELELVADIRRRLPVLEAKALGGGGRVGRVLFSPISELGGMALGQGGTHKVLCPPFRTWHRLGK